MALPTTGKKFSEADAAASMDAPDEFLILQDGEVKRATYEAGRGPAGADGADGAGIAPAGTTGQVLAKASGTDFDTEWVEPAGGDVDSVNTQTGAVVLDPDDLDDSATTNKFTTAAEITKLAGIETAATADQTGAEIKSLYEAEADTNAFTDAEKTKLTGIETGATADQTGAQIKTAYEAEANTNAFTDAEQTKLAGIETAADVTDTANVMASIDVGGLTEELTPAAADFLLLEDAAGTLLKVDWASLPGAGGGISNVVEDTTPQLGGALDVNGQSIVSVTAGNIAITPDTTGSVILDGLSWPQADGTDGQVLTTNGLGQLAWEAGGGGGLANVVEDLTPQAGGDFDMNGFDLQLQAGSAAAPSLTFLLDPDTGIYRISADTLGVAAGGSLRLQIGSFSILPFLPLHGANGTSAAPTYSFSSDTNTGIYRVGVDSLGVAAGGNLIAAFTATEVLSNVPFRGSGGSASAPVFSFLADSDTGLYRVGADSLGVSVGGTLRVTFNTTNLTSTVPFLGPVGSAAAPGYGFSSDPDTGFYRIGTDWMGAVAGGVVAWTWSETGGVASIEFEDNVVTRAVMGDFAIQNASPASSAGTLTLDYTTGPDFDLQLAENVTTLTITNWPASGNLGKITLQLRQPTAGTFTSVFTDVDFGDAGTPTVPTGTGAIIEVAIWTRDGGTTKYGSVYFEKAGA